MEKGQETKETLISKESRIMNDFPPCLSDLPLRRGAVARASLYPTLLQASRCGFIAPSKCLWRTVCLVLAITADLSN